MAFWKLHKIPILLSLVSLAFYFSFAYHLERSNFLKLVIVFAGLFFLYYKLIGLAKTNFKLLFWLSIAFRVVFLFAIPNLSQDFYRFIWDGRMILEGLNPYLFTPESFISNGEFPVNQAQELYEGMGHLSAGHYSNYPPLNQLCFVIAGLFAGNSILGSVVIMRLLIISADLGTLYFGKKLLERLQIPVHNIFWYILNPFIIIELSGNLHFEGIMIFLLVWSLYLLHSGKWLWSALIFSLSISIKLIPLIFLPLLLQKLGWKKSIGFYGIVGLFSMLLFLPFYSQEFVNNFTSTIGLWFQNFEFNASLYYIAREIGYTYRGFNEIAIIGSYIPYLVISFVLLISVIRNNSQTIALISAMLLGLSFYFFTATTVHPWYIATLLALSVFTKYKFPIVWSFMIMLSYLSYQKSGFNENLIVIAIEYLVVYSVFLWEIFYNRNKTTIKASSNHSIPIE